MWTEDKSEIQYMVETWSYNFRKMYTKIEVSEVLLTPYKEAPALKVSLKARAAKVV